MELREYLTIRRSYNLVRREADGGGRLTFAEFAILCRLELSGCAINTSRIAEYQGALRPTMTHRAKHLAELGLISREQGSDDRRNMLCTITPKGTEVVWQLCERICDLLKRGQVLSRTTPRRVGRYIDAMGAAPYLSSDLVLLRLFSIEGQGSPINGLVNDLGLLQPTVSMSVGSLVEEGLVQREPGTRRMSNVMLTEAGAERAWELAEKIAEIVVRRN